MARTENGYTWTVVAGKSKKKFIGPKAENEAWKFAQMAIKWPEVDEEVVIEVAFKSSEEQPFQRFTISKWNEEVKEVEGLTF